MAGSNADETTEKKDSKFYKPRYAEGYEWTNERGQVFVQCHDHPNARGDGFVARSRLVMEVLEGRLLEPQERVYHYPDEDVSNDDPENLMLFPNQKALMQFISQNKKDQRAQQNRDTVQQLRDKAEALRAARQAAAEKGAAAAKAAREARQNE